jgi:small subunit ribosomal protein S1
VGESKGSVVLSRRQLLRRADEEKAGQLIANIKPGDELEGTVARLETFGAFVDLGGVDGMVHVSEIRHERVAHPGQVLQAGEKVKVKVLRVETGRDGRPRIALSIKATAADPWQGIEARYPVGARVMGVVARLADFGAFVTLEPGIDGLVHVSEVALERIGHVREVLTPGQAIEAVVLGVDPEKKRVSLSVRRATEGWTPEQEAAAGPARAFGGERPARGDRPRREGGPRERGPRRDDRDEGPRRGRDRGPSRDTTTTIISSKPSGEPELTTMAIALRAALERAKQKENGGQ